MAGRRALAVVEAVSRAAHGGTFSDLSARLSLSDASLTRLLKVLLDEQWIRQERPSGRYFVAHRMLALAHDLRGVGLHNPLVQGEVTTLAHVTGHSACVATFHGDYFTLVAKFEMLGSYHFIDLFLPNTDWIDNGMGRFLLAFQPEHMVSLIYRRVFGTEVPQEHWRTFERIRRNGSHVSEEETVTRVMAAVEGGAGNAVEGVIAIAALKSKAIDVDAAMAQVRHAAAETRKRLAATA